MTEKLSREPNLPMQNEGIVCSRVGGQEIRQNWPRKYQLFASLQRRKTPSVRSHKKPTKGELTTKGRESPPIIETIGQTNRFI